MKNSKVFLGLFLANLLVAPFCHAQEGAAAKGQTPPAEPPKQTITPEQRRERQLKPYVTAMPDLTEEQKAKLVDIVAATSLKYGEIRRDTATSLEQKRALERKAYADSQEQVLGVLTDAQKKVWKPIVDEVVEFQAGTVSHMGRLIKAESREEKRARVSAGYEPILDELPIRKRSTVLETLGAADDVAVLASQKTDLTEAQRATEIAAANKEALDKILPLLNKDQQDRWKKAQAARVAKDAEKKPADKPAAEAPKY